MSAEKKVELILSVKDEYGVAPVLRALDLPRSTWHYHSSQSATRQYRMKRNMPMFALFWKMYCGNTPLMAFPG
jgi:hypothetical protein